MPVPFVYLSAYRVAPDKLDEFEYLHGSNGSLADLFRRAPGYMDTELLEDRNAPDRFITIDRWESDEAFSESFAEESSTWIAWARN